MFHPFEPSSPARRVYFTPFAEVLVGETADLVLTESKSLLLETNRNKFQSKWQRGEIDVACYSLYFFRLSSRLSTAVLSCHYLHETVQSQYDAYIAATRLSSFRLLFLDWIVPEPDRDSGSIRTINMLQVLRPCLKRTLYFSDLTPILVLRVSRFCLRCAPI